MAELHPDADAILYKEDYAFAADVFPALFEGLPEGDYPARVFHGTRYVFGDASTASRPLYCIVRPTTTEDGEVETDIFSLDITNEHISVVYGCDNESRAALSAQKELYHEMGMDVLRAEDAYELGELFYYLRTEQALVDEMYGHFAALDAAARSQLVQAVVPAAPTEFYRAAVEFSAASTKAVSMLGKCAAAYMGWWIGIAGGGKKA